MNKKQPVNHLTILIKGSIISFLGTGCLGILNYFVRRELALSLNLADFGFIYSVLALCNIFLAYLDMGLGQSAIILISKAFANKLKPLGNRYYLQILLLKFFFAIIVFIILVLTYKFWIVDFLKYSNTTPFFILLSLIVIQAVSSAPGAVTNALKKFALFNTAQILTPITILIIILFCNPIHSMNIYALAFPIGALVMFIYLFIVMLLKGYYPNAKSVKELFAISEIFHLGKWIAISTLGLTTMYYMDSLMLTWLDGLKAVGLYNIALPIMQIAQSLMVIPAVFLPIVSGMWMEDREIEISNICKTVSEITIYIFWPIAFSIILLAKYIIIFLFAPKFIAAAPALIILFVGNIFFSLASFYMGTLNAGKYAKSVALTIIVSALVNIVLNYFLIPYLGITGAAIATAISYLFIAYCLYILLKCNLNKFSIDIKKILKFSSSGIICLLIALNLNFEVQLNIWCILGFTILINLVYFGLTLRVVLNYYKIATKIFKN